MRLGVRRERCPLPEPRRPPGGGDVEVDWTPVTSTDQGSAPFDPGGMATAAGFAGGVFSATTDVGHVTNVSGYRSALLRWTIDLLGMFPQLDPAKHLVDLRVRDTTGLEGGGTDDWGIFAGILGGGTGDLATIDGAAAAVYRQTATPNDRVVTMGRSAVASTASVGDCDGFVATFGWALDGGDLYDPWLSAIVRDPATTRFNFGSAGSGGGSIPDSVALSAWRIHTGLIHVSTDAAAIALAWELDARLLRRTSPNW